MPVSRRGTWSRSSSRPLPARAAISTDDEVSPAAPMSWMPTSTSVGEELEARLEEQLLDERIADLHRRALRLGPSSSNSAEAMVAPWMPSRPVLAPK